MIVPAILAFAFLRMSTYFTIDPLILIILALAIWIGIGVAPVYFVQDQVLTAPWSSVLGMTGLVLSMIVNGLVMGLIVLKIFRVLREVKAASDNGMLGASGRSKLRPILFVLIESGMMLFSIQLIRLVVSRLFVPWRVDSPGADNAYPFFSALHGMFNVIIRTHISILFC